MCRPPGKLDFVDHVVGNQPDFTMENVTDWYVISFLKFWIFSFLMIIFSVFISSMWFNILLLSISNMKYFKTDFKLEGI